eukprot:463920_1
MALGQSASTHDFIADYQTTRSVLGFYVVKQIFLCWISMEWTKTFTLKMVIFYLQIIIKFINLIKFALYMMGLHVVFMKTEVIGASCLENGVQQQHQKVIWILMNREEACDQYYMNRSPQKCIK